MAIDSAPKRKSLVTISFYPCGPGVSPDATPDQAWRQAAGYGYVGILAGAQVATLQDSFTVRSMPIVFPPV